MRIPKKVKVGAHEYIVRHAPHGGDTFGMCNFKDLEIFIDPRTAKSQQEETFFHEVVHAIFEAQGETQDEGKVQRLGHDIYHFLKTNKLLK